MAKKKQKLSLSPKTSFFTALFICTVIFALGWKPFTQGDLNPPWLRVTLDITTTILGLMAFTYSLSIARKAKSSFWAALNYTAIILITCWLIMGIAAAIFTLSLSSDWALPG
jgi:hypothetical protein